jgi:GDPmannose 4,6-dehydratase
MKKKVAIIVGSSGQDGKILSSYLKKINYKVIGIDKNGPALSKINISSKEAVYDLIKKSKPDQIYFLAARHGSSQDKIGDYATEFSLSFRVNALALINFLEGVRIFSAKTRIFYAASSLIFGNNGSIRKTEVDRFCPNSVYGITKMSGVMACRLYREKYGVFASTGILFNHESEYRTENFVFMKIIKGAMDIKMGRTEKIVVGDIDAKVDWGYAYDFVEAMHLILGHEKADDFIISTGKLHSIKDLIKAVFKEFDIDWRGRIVEKKDVITADRRRPAYGDFRKLNKATSWTPKHSFEEMIRLIIKKKYGAAID